MSPDRTAADAHLAEVEAEQAALRRIAALLTRSVPAEEVFDAVVDEVRSLMGVDAASLLRYEADKTATLLAVSAEADARVDLPVDKVSTEGHNITALVCAPGGPHASTITRRPPAGSTHAGSAKPVFGRPWVHPSSFENRCGGCLPSTQCTGGYPRIRRRVSRTSPRWS